VYSFEELTHDPHFQARCTYEVDYPGHPDLKLTATPVKVEGQEYGVTLAPFFAEHTAEVLGAVLGYDDDTLAKLAADGVIAFGSTATTGS
jgi:crotonobetainyl-CoA:carnitine CoA-transferase CaiB-like acyl-CoA transferase